MIAIIPFFLLCALNLFAQPIELPLPPAKEGNPKLESALWDVAAAGRGLRKPVALPRRLQSTRDGKVIVFLVPEFGKYGSAIDTQAIARLGGEVLAASKHFVRVAISPEHLEDATSIQGVRFIQRPIRPQRQRVVSEGASEINALANHGRGVKGQGVKVAIIDPGFAGANLLPEDMPLTWRLKDFTAPNDSIYSGTSRHGTACAEVVYDIAPEVSLFLLKIADLADFENAKDVCLQEGVDIVSYSGSWLGTGFGDGLGVACDIVNDAADNGVLWVNSAGNHARSQYTGLWADRDSNGWGEFKGVDAEVLEFSRTIDAGEVIEIFLTWNDWPASSQNYDLYLYKFTAGGGVEIVAESINIQKNSDPAEHIEYMVTSSGRFGVAVRKTASARTEVIKVWSVNDLDFKYPTALVGSIATPADARGSLSVGAIDQRNWERGVIEPFSSRGPTVDGRIKPDLVAPDGVSTISYRPAPFYGTSAAAPHVAGAAALIKSANPSYTRQQLWDALIAATVDLGRVGQDTTYGYGKLVLPVLQAAPPVAAPVAAFTPSITAGSAPLAVSFTNQSVGSAASYLWDFGDGTTGSDTSPTHTYTKAGTYTIQLTATNTGGDSKASWTITVTGPSPVAAFTPSVSSGSAPLTVSFANQSTGSPTSYGWDFGDGSTSTEPNPKHTYTKGGTYTVRLIATNAAGTSTASMTITVTAPLSPPVAAFTPSVTYGSAPLTVSFTNQSTGIQTTYSWDFGDGGTSSTISPNHTYTKTGRYTVRLTATNPGGSTQASRLITVVPVSVLPTELIMADTQVGKTAQKVFTVTNGSSSSVTVTLSVGGEDASQFSISPGTALLGAGRSRSFTATFSPTGTGAKTASISIGYGSSGAPLSVSLRGQATAPSVAPLTILPTELVMADTRVDSTSQKTFSITSNASKSVTITLSIGGTDASQFRVTPGTATLRAGKTRSFTVSFSPTSTGLMTASISISHDAGGNPLAVALKGQAIVPVVGVSLSVRPTELTMSDTRVNSATDKILTVTNSSSKSIPVTLSIDGADASHFVVIPAAATLLAGKTRSFTVAFSPQSAGSKTASILIRDNAGRTLLSVALRGHGIGENSTTAGTSVTQIVSGRLTATSLKFPEGWYYNMHAVQLGKNQMLSLRLLATPPANFEYYFAGVWDALNSAYVAGNHRGFIAQSDTILIPHDGWYYIVVTDVIGATGSYTFTATAVPGPLEIGPAIKPVALVEESASTEVAASDPGQLPANYPNPFNANTTISYSLPIASRVRLEVYDLMGQLVRVLAEGWQEMGDHRVSWDGRDGQGQSVSSGVYLYRLGDDSGKAKQVRRMLLLR